MSERITIKDVRRAVEAHAKCLERCGIVYEGALALQVGSQTNGLAWRLHRWVAYVGYAPPIGDDYLGRTAREAYDRLTERTRTVYDVRLYR